MSSLNKVQLIGHLGRDPESRSFSSGDKVVNLRIATTEKWKDRQTNEQREKTEWHSVAIFGQGLVRVAETYLRKGSKVYVEGQLETRKWQDQSGADRYSTEIVLKGFNAQMVLLDSQGGGAGRGSGGGDDWSSDNDFAGQSSAGGGRGGGYNSGARAGAAAGGGRDFGGSGFPSDDLDDDVPF